MKTKNPIDESRLRAMWADKGLRVAEIAEALGISITRLNVAVRSLGLPPRNLGGQAAQSRHRDPTIEEIDQRCAEARKLRPQKFKKQRWELPQYSYSGVHCTFDPM
jgi:hypothetical protein